MGPVALCQQRHPLSQTVKDTTFIVKKSNYIVGEHVEDYCNNWAKIDVSVRDWLMFLYGGAWGSLAVKTGVRAGKVSGAFNDCPHVGF